MIHRLARLQHWSDQISSKESAHAPNDSSKHARLVRSVYCNATQPDFRLGICCGRQDAKVYDGSQLGRDWHTISQRRLQQRVESNQIQANPLTASTWCRRSPVKENSLRIARSSSAGAQSASARTRMASASPQFDRASGNAFGLTNLSVLTNTGPLSTT